MIVGVRIPDRFREEMMEADLLEGRQCILQQQKEYPGKDQNDKDPVEQENLLDQFFFEFSLHDFYTIIKFHNIKRRP
jgi:hypothetical protein